MKMRASMAVLAVVAMATTASAAKLVVTGVTSLPAGGIHPATKVITIGVDISDEVAANGGNPVGVGVQEILVTDGVVDGTATGNPRQVGTSQTRQEVQDKEDQALANSGLTNDSWWYASGNGNHTTQEYDEFGEPVGGPVDIGDLWLPQVDGVTGGVGQGSDMGFTGIWGPIPTVTTGPILPLIQVRIGGDVNFSGQIGIGTSLLVDVSGGPAAEGAGLVLDYETGQFQEIPEPSTIALLSMGLIGLAVGAWRRRK